MNRRQFLRDSAYASILFGTGGLPQIISESSAAFAPLGAKKILLNITLTGGPDMRHMIVPEYSTNSHHFGYHYWRNRTRSHAIGDAPSAMKAHWNNNFTHHSHNGVKFGIAKSCGWFAQMWKAGNVAIICNAYTINTRAHDYAMLILNQGNRTSRPGQIERSGWGGRLAATTGGNAISLTDTTSRFNFGPAGSNINAVDNRHVISIANSRDMGVYKFDRSRNARYGPRRDIAARTATSYYKTLHAELPENSIYQRFLDHEAEIRDFTKLIQGRLRSVPIPARIRALSYNNRAKTKLNKPKFARQILNAYDSIASNDLLQASVLSMEYGGWDTHENQNARINRSFSDLFGKDKGLSALWQALKTDAGVNTNRGNLAILTAGEFGRQLRDNGGNGTDHGQGNMMFLFGEKVRGGVYGEMFPLPEIDRIQNPRKVTPEILGLTQIDHPFGEICNWVQPGASTFVFPDRGRAKIERANMFHNLLRP